SSWASASRRAACAGTFATLVLFSPLGASAQDVASEIGANDFRISDMGPDGNSSFQAFPPDVV
ncbi:MAG: hypothetical protein ACE5MI_13550, partial [Acidimicrobiia bacterium]